MSAESRTPSVPVVEPYAVGICSASVCAERGVPIERIEEIVNRQHPTGISSPWRFADDAPTFRTGQPNPCPCDRDPDNRLHWLLQC